ncbi:hypothetical protein GGR28_000159 [Lewinella aquimaris]|uniref:Uncharacterized protein n=1 Tax=Neolewinella aquimaris TaxID=1835722 RepID=A0A840E617_9BACT|nr:hypothetical protein [Neolewinella aquimaris]MBB4077558.1 hypothetical protein [Neolewinella aquimaris]
MSTTQFPRFRQSLITVLLLILVFSFGIGYLGGYLLWPVALH